MIALDTQKPSQVTHYFEESLVIAQKTGRLWVEAMVWNNLGILSGMIGDFSQAEENYHKALILAQETGNRRGEGLVLGNLGWIAGVLGNYKSARSYLEQNLRIAREIGDQETLAYTLVNLTSVAERQGDILAAQSFSEQVLTLTHQSGGRSAEAWACLFTGHVFMGLSQPGVAIVYYQRGLAIREELSQTNLSCEIRAGLAQALLADGKPAQAAEQVRLILEFIDGGGTLDGADEPMRVYLGCIKVLEANGDSRVSSLLEKAYTMIQERAAKITNQTSRHSFLENVPYHHEIIQRWQGFHR
jgi:tetratricopeptide (TPR) repeat protein